MSSTRARLALSLAGIVLLAGTLYAVQAVKESMIITSILESNSASIKQIYRVAHEMKRKARPFAKQHHRDHFRFDPGSKEGRTILGLSRGIASQLSLLNGVLCHAPVPKKKEVIRDMQERCKTVGVFAKRSLRAVRDGNFALYMASAQAIEKETRLLDETVYKLENMINASIQSTDEVMEDL